MGFDFHGIHLTQNPQVLHVSRPLHLLGELVAGELPVHHLLVLGADGMLLLVQEGSSGARGGRSEEEARGGGGGGQTKQSRRN